MDVTQGGRMAMRPELLVEANPFLEALPPPIAINGFPRMLQCCPLDGVKWTSLKPIERELLLNYESFHFVPTRKILQSAASIQLLLRRALLQRNPTHKEQQRLANVVAMADHLEQVRALKPMDGGGGLLAGITGTGKTALVRRVLDLIAPEQVIQHGKSAVCGWKSLQQCFYLHIDFASNGTRGALLHRVLEALDAACGTDYSEKHKKHTNLDTLLVLVCKLLVLHRVALLVVDENQKESFGSSPWSIQFILFYLMLMNLGVSVLLIGNPLAFENLLDFSQLQRRFSTGGITTLQPAKDATEDWWAKDLIPRARKFSLVEKWDIAEDARRKYEYESTGGLPGLLMPYSSEVQRIALHRGGKQAIVTEADFKKAIRSDRYKGLYKVALAARDASESHRFMDIPDRVQESLEFSKESAGSIVRPTIAQVSALQRYLTNFNRERTLNTNKLIEKAKTLISLSDDDIRLLGLKERHLDELRKIASRLMSSSKKNRATSETQAT